MSGHIFNEDYWVHRITKPDWYKNFASYMEESSAFLNDDPAEQGKFNKSVRKFFEKMLMAERVNLASRGPDLDSCRLPIDTIVIHHTSALPGYDLDYMNAVQLLNVYVRAYVSPSVRRERGLKGDAIWSGHFRSGQQSFLAYHWLMRMDGAFEKLLDDDRLGWHAGNWGINRRSVAICLDNDYEKQDPTNEVLQKLAAHIKKHYPDIKSANIIGHCEARKGTICPGTNFIAVWKPKLVRYMG